MINIEPDDEGLVQRALRIYHGLLVNNHEMLELQLMVLGEDPAQIGQDVDRLEELNYRYPFLGD
jgi:DNA topoisomerase VI subunit A